MTSKTQTEEYLRKTQLPQKTKSYTVISHGVIIDTVREMLSKYGFTIKSELYKSEFAGDVALGFMQIENDLDPDMAMTFNWTNSYNKKIRFSCAVGGFIYDNEVPFVSTENKASWKRKHTGTALDETLEIIEAMVSSAEEHFAKIIEMKNKFKTIALDRKGYAKLMGLLYFDKQLIGRDQVNIVKREYDKPSFNYEDKGTLWELYKMIMYSIVDQAPVHWYKQQYNINNYIQILFNISSTPLFNEQETDLYVESDQEYLEEIEQVESEAEEEQVANDDTESIFTAMHPVTPEKAFPPKLEFNPQERLEEIREELNNETISYGELAELQELTEFIEEGDVQLLEAAGVPEFPIEEIESVDNFILAQNEVKEAIFTPVKEEETLFIEDVIFPSAMSEEQIDLVKEEYGVVEKGSPDDGFIGSTETNTNDLFTLFEEDEEEETIPWLDEQPIEEEEQIEMPSEVTEEIDSFLKEMYSNRNNKIKCSPHSHFTVVELDTKEFAIFDN